MSLVRFRSEAPFADLAHLVERDLAKVEVAGSSPVIRSKNMTVPKGCRLFLFLSRITGHLTRGFSPVRSHSRSLSGVKPFANSLLCGLHGGEKRRLEVFLLVLPVIRSKKSQVEIRLGFFQLNPPASE